MATSRLICSRIDHLTSTNQSLSTRPHVFISAAEPSADLHGAALIRATLAKCPATRFVGVAGPRMAAAGCEVIFDMTRHSAMLLGSVSAAGRAIAMMRICGRYLRNFTFDGAVVIDSPTLHLPLAARAQAAGIPVLYYIAPQMWAWGTYRVHKLRDRADRVAVILPFEEEFFRGFGVRATYVGHPLADALASRSTNQEMVQKLRGAGSPVIALLPGSRKQVVAGVLPGQLEVAEAISAAIPGASFVVSEANPQVAPVVSRLISSCRCRIQAHLDGHAEVIQAADLVLVASGTSTLEVALYGRPMIVMYNASAWFHHLIARWMIHTRYLSLPNILAGREIVPEFMPYYRSTAPIATRAIELLQSPAARAAMVAELHAVVEPLRGTSASDRTAALLLDMMQRSPHAHR